MDIARSSDKSVMVALVCLVLSWFGFRTCLLDEVRLFYMALDTPELTVPFTTLVALLQRTCLTASWI